MATPFDLEILMTPFGLTNPSAIIQRSLARYVGHNFEALLLPTQVNAYDATSGKGWCHHISKWPM